MAPNDTFMGGSGVVYSARLYPGAINNLNQAPVGSTAEAHRLAGLALASSLKPLNAAGQVDTANGVILVSSVGQSLTVREFRRFQEILGCNIYSNPGVSNELVGSDVSCRPGGKVNPKVDLHNGAQGATTCPLWLGNFGLWDIRGNDGYTEAQVQVLYIKIIGCDDPNGNCHDQNHRACLGELVRNAKTYYPNLKMAFVSSRVNGSFGGGIASDLTSYQHGFAVKDLIEDQINGDSTLAYSGATPVAPWLAWGPYLWANLDAPRSDGLAWTCQDYSQDNTHNSQPYGDAKVGEQLVNFFATSEFTAPWFLNPNPPTAECTTDAQCADACTNTAEKCITSIGRCYKPDIGRRCQSDADCTCGVCVGSMCYGAGPAGTCPYPTCSGPICGDGIVNGSEQCDDGNANICDGCSPSCQSQTPEDCGNLLANGRFEAGDQQWGATQSPYVVSTTTFYEGSKSIQGTPGSASLNKSQMTADNSVVAGTTYKFRGYLKTQGMSSTARFLIYWKNSSGATVGISWTPGTLGGTNDWTLISGEQQAPTGATRAQIQLFMNAGSGTVWFDKAYFGTDTYCGNGVVNAAQGEVCDDGNRFSCDGCSANCTATETLTQWYSDFDHDGYGVNPPLELTYCPLDADRAPNNTDCDDNNPAIHTGCGAGCTPGIVCHASAGACDVAEICSGGGTCPADGFASSGTLCRASAGACDVAETCSGSSASCPSEGFLAAGSAGSPTCSPYVCGGGAASCPTSCASSADCASGYTCSSNVCVAGATNSVVNPSFESTPSASDWGASLPSAFSRVTSPSAQAGTYSMKFTTTKANTSSLLQQRNVSANTVYNFSGYIQTASMTGTGSSFRLTWMNGAAVLRIDTVATALTGTNGWTLRSGTYTSPSNTTSVKVELYSVTGSTGGTAYFDTLSLVQQ